MRVKSIVFALCAVVAVAMWAEADACTSAVISGRATKSGRPLLWKHRDTGTEWNHIEYFKGDKYGFSALVNSRDKERKEAWAGANEKGFAIMNTASYNMKPDSLKYLPEREGEVMKDALGKCATVAEFEEYIKNMKLPRALETNFGVIDAEGGAAYFEVWDYGYTKYDANDEANAPNGYIIRSNYSFSGAQDEGMGYIRYQNAEYLIHRAYAAGELSAEWIFEGASRSFFNAILDSDLLTEAGRPESGWAIDQDYIPRNSSSASVVVEGVKKGDNPDATTIWSVLGYPPCSYAVAAWVKAEKEIAPIIAASEDGHSPINLMAVDLKRKVFPVERGNGKRYMRVDVIERAIEALRPYEVASMRSAAKVRDQIAKKGFDKNLVKEYNNAVTENAPLREEVVRQVMNR